MGRTQIPDQHGTGIDADAGLESRAPHLLPLLVHRGKPLLHGQRRGAGIVGMKRLFDGGTIDGQELIAGVFHQGTLEAEDPVGHFFEILAEKENHLLGWEAF